VVQGISVGYGAAYDAFLEGQHVEITGLPAGRYRLVHRVNADRRLREASLANNAAAVSVRLTWRGGRPRVTRVG
jgi:Lysyl oxidase